MLLEDFIITAYCVIDATLKNFLGTQKLRQRGFEPNLSDSEIMTVEKFFSDTMIKFLSGRIFIFFAISHE